ncbi:hypothetical protein [Bradyrhizobium sp. STM 3843]|uniref:hypothetical protein n=1 Tax=Bradyrhizobium sp. STM 3843 TaxID=551947 RepID=UPI0015863CC3|nr:hypothetical protein [Bradyrhizobium sp. STM 3843]
MAGTLIEGSRPLAAFVCRAAAGGDLHCGGHPARPKLAAVPVRLDGQGVPHQMRAAAY